MSISDGQTTDAALVERLRGGDRDALATLMRIYTPRLAPFVVRYVGSMDAADDVLQELFIRLWERRETWELRGTLRVYLFTAARNAALHWRARGDARARAEHAAFLAAENDAEPVDVAEAVERQDLAAVVRAAVAELPERGREIFMLSREHGFSYSEIATMLGISVSAVKTHMGRAMIAIDRKLAPFFLAAVIVALR